MKKLIGIFLLLSIFNITFAQNDLEYQKVFNNMYVSLDRRSFNNSDFADSVKIFIFVDRNVVHNKRSHNQEAVNDLNTAWIYLPYDRFRISMAKSDLDKGFIIHLYKGEEMSVIYMILDTEGKIEIILIKK